MKLKYLLLLLLVVVPIYAQEGLNLPQNLQKIQEYNEQVANQAYQNIGFILAFIAGLTIIFSPCLFPLLPAYFAITFKEKRHITKMCIVFFIGFMLVFVSMGVIAGLIGQTSLLILQNRAITLISGIGLIILGILFLFGFSIGINHGITKKFKNNTFGVFLSGIFFTLGWTACTGAVLSGILLSAVYLGNVFRSGLLLFFYALGNFVPFLILSVFYDRLNVSKILKLGSYKIKFLGVKTTISNLVSAILLMLIGLAIIVFNGTGFINGLNLLGTTDFFYEVQRNMLGI